MKIIMTLVILICIMAFQSKAQDRVICLNERNYENVYFPDSWDSTQSAYYKKIALIINKYVNKYHNKRDLELYIRFYGTRYIADVDDRHGDYVLNLVQNKENPQIGIKLIFPDTILLLSKVIKLTDIGFSKFNELRDCKISAITSKKYADQYKCKLSTEYIDSMLNCELTAKKNRFIKRMERKYFSISRSSKSFRSKNRNY